MTYTVLHIDSSPMGDRSVTKKLSKKLVTELVISKGAQLISHDFGTHPLPHLSGEVLAAIFTPLDQQTEAQKELVKTSDTMVDELLAADVIVVGAPMWNFSVPSALKAWIDHISRAGKTFKYTESGPKGLVSSDKKVIVVSSRGGIYTEGPAQAFDFQEAYLKAVFGFLGITDVSFVRAEGVSMGPDAVSKALQAADQQILELVK